MARQGSIERTGGLYRILESPVPYTLFQRALGASRVYATLVDRFLDLEPGMRVLDVGAGTAALRDVLGDVSYTALEPNPSYVQAMRERFANGDEVVIEGTTAAMGEVEGTFDRVIMFALLHHLDDVAASEALGQAAAALSPDGRLVALDIGFHPGQGRIARALAKVDRGANVRHHDGYANLARPYFDAVRTEVTTGLIRVPYSHIWTVCEGPRPALQRAEAR